MVDLLNGNYKQYFMLFDPNLFVSYAPFINLFNEIINSDQISTHIKLSHCSRCFEEFSDDTAFASIIQFVNEPDFQDEVIDIISTLINKNVNGVVGCTDIMNNAQINYTTLFDNILQKINDNTSYRNMARYTISFIFFFCTQYTQPDDSFNTYVDSFKDTFIWILKTEDYNLIKNLFTIVTRYTDVLELIISDLKNAQESNINSDLEDALFYAQESNTNSELGILIDAVIKMIFTQ